MKSSNFYGLRGTSLNIAIAIIAGTDFALFGYDQVSHRVCSSTSPVFLYLVNRADLFFFSFPRV